MTRAMNCLVFRKFACSNREFGAKNAIMLTELSQRPKFTGKESDSEALSALYLSLILCVSRGVCVVDDEVEVGQRGVRADVLGHGHLDRLHVEPRDLVVLRGSFRAVGNIYS